MMNVYLAAVLSCLLFISPSKPEKVIVARFTLYVDSNKFQDGEPSLEWESEVDKNVYRNDCMALYDLFQKRFEICDEQELLLIQRILEEMEAKQKPEQPNYNKL